MTGPSLKDQLSFRAEDGDKAALIAAAAEMRDALAEWVRADDDFHAFERDNPNDSTRRWEAKLDAVAAAKDNARDVLARANGG